jgi:aryl-alcohol dehydrogenase-like predicted oxidoreductase
MRPAAVKTALAYSLRRLGTDYVDLYQPARLDPAVPVEDTVGAIGDMIDAGYVRYAGLSKMGAGTIRRAAAGAVAGERYDERQMAALDSERS